VNNDHIKAKYNGTDVGLNLDGEMDIVWTQSVPSGIISFQDVDITVNATDFLDYDLDLTEVGGKALYDVIVGNLPKQVTPSVAVTKFEAPPALVGMDLRNPDARRAVDMVLAEHFPSSLTNFLNFDYCYAHLKDLGPGDSQGNKMDVIPNFSPTFNKSSNFRTTPNCTIENNVGVMRFDGLDDFVNLNPVEVGGNFSVMVVAQFDELNNWDGLLDFGTHEEKLSYGM